MAKPILIANWKNHPSSLFEAQVLLKDLSRKRELFKKFSLFIAPPPFYFESVFERAGFANLASQDLEYVDILKSFGTKIAIIGHSDRRALGETNEIINKKIKLAIRRGFAPLLCIGELKHDHDGEHFEFLHDQLRQALYGIKKNDASKLMVAYEPVWAIGRSAKESIGTEALGETVIFIKKVLSDMFGRKAADKIAILYGGAVEASNAGDLMRESGIKGFLVGHASLNVRGFEGIAKSMIMK